MTDGPFLAFLDLGEVNDYSTPGVLSLSRRRVPTPANKPPRFDAIYTLAHLERWRGIRYPEQVRRMVLLLKRHPLYGNTEALVIDGTGVGRPVVELFLEADLPSGLRVVPIVITSGEAISQRNGFVCVPKRHLVSVVQRVLANDRLWIPRQLDEVKGPDGRPQGLARIAVDELKAFRYRITDKAHVAFEAGREKDHDDIVLGIGMGCWLAERLWGGPEGEGGNIVVQYGAAYGRAW